MATVTAADGVPRIPHRACEAGTGAGSDTANTLPGPMPTPAFRPSRSKREPPMQHSELKNLKIAVVGAGYGGAAAAKALSLLGAKVDVYEQAHQIR
ncbi:NAD(P)-binding protein, partial [Streptomyces hirsutus]|uniref:NAD(P)-binding protein n=1 Tax=Streptomyces hirsutus TaxID=35620 RepID=UPI0036C0F8A4